MLFSGAPIAGAAFADVGDLVINTTVSVTGFEATGGVGSVAVTGTANLSLTGVAGTGAVGDEVVTADAPVPVTGLSATASSENADDVIAKAVVETTGLESTATLGDITLYSNNYLDVALGTLVPYLGNETVVATALVEATGVSGTLTLDDETVTAAAVVIETGLEATASLGNEEPVEADAVVVEDGVEGTGVVNWSTANLITNNYLDVTGFSATAALGDNGEDEGTGDANVLPTGVSATATIAGRLSISVIGNLTITPTGVVGTTGEPKVTLWGGGSDDIPPEYTDAYREGFWTEIAA